MIRVQWKREPGRRSRRLAGDLALAVLLGVLSLPSAFGDDGFKQPAWAAVLLVELAALPVALRRVYPSLVLAITLGAAIVNDIAFGGFQFPGAAIALYTVATRYDRRRSLLTALAVALALTIPVARAAGSQPIFAVATYAVFAAAWLLGDGLRTRRAYLAELEARAERLERERLEEADRAVAAERARIARELHDVISHNVSVMVVQAAAGVDVFETNPRHAREALGAIQSAGREALSELRQLLGVVDPGDGGDRPGFEPQPGVSRLPELVDQVRAAGLEVAFELTGGPATLPATLDLAVYRIVQEALTNTVKHADARRARVRVSLSDGAVEIEVVDDGRRAPGDLRSGRGLIGMRERVAIVGGTFSAGTGPSGGFRVHATMPVQDVAR